MLLRVENCMDAKAVPLAPCRAMTIVGGTGCQYLTVWYRDCGHRGRVDPGRVTARTRLRCTKCGSRRYDVRVVWEGGKPPRNVLPFRKR